MSNDSYAFLDNIRPFLHVLFLLICHKRKTSIMRITHDQNRYSTKRTEIFCRELFQT